MAKVTVGVIISPRPRGPTEMCLIHNLPAAARKHCYLKPAQARKHRTPRHALPCTKPPLRGTRRGLFQLRQPPAVRGPPTPPPPCPTHPPFRSPIRSHIPPTPPRLGLTTTSRLLPPSPTRLPQVEQQRTARPLPKTPPRRFPSATGARRDSCRRPITSRQKVGKWRGAGRRRALAQTIPGFLPCWREGRTRSRPSPRGLHPQL